MEKIVILVGASGDLGGRILTHLLNLRENGKAIKIRCLVRSEAAKEKLLKQNYAEVETICVDFTNREKLQENMRGGSVVVCALSGLRKIIIDTQQLLVRAAIEAGVPRFIPSDFAIDFREVPEGDNRNLNLRRENMLLLPEKEIQVTSVLNGAFTDMLTGIAPYILFSWKKILCWGDINQKMDWTTIEDTAKYTAFVALDETTPRWLTIAGDEPSAVSLCDTMTELTGTKHKIFKPGGPQLLKFMIAATKFFSKESQEIYPPWQGMQYMRDMYIGKVKFKKLDNARYQMNFTTAKDVLKEHLNMKR